MDKKRPTPIDQPVKWDETQTIVSKADFTFASQLLQVIPVS